MKTPIQNLVRVEGIDRKLAEHIKRGGDEAIVDQQLESLEKHQVQYITIWDSAYPLLLKRISDAPVVLFYKGALKEIHQKAIAVVGMRSPSNYGKTVTTELVRQLVLNEITIVSGMARGVDSIAHQTALQTGGETLAVLGCGMDYCYPPENKQLYHKISDNGAVISEYFMGTGPDAANFPKRNRIISGLSLGTLVIEAGNRSGALISALFALNQNREVFAVPGNINSHKSIGSNRLIQQGAKLVLSVDDILEEIGEIPSSSQVRQKKIPENLGETEKAILEKLSIDPKHIDRLVMELHETPSTILAGLLTLELLGLVQQLAGKMFVRL
jgi:DNA processing protein